MATSNLNDYSQVYVSAEDSYFPYQSPFPSLRIVINVVQTYQCDTDNTNTCTEHNSTQEFEYPFDRFGSFPSPESDAVVSDMLSAVEIPFPLENLNGINWLNGDRLVTPLNSINDMLRMISEVACQVVREGTSRMSLVMDVRIENRLIVPRSFIESIRRTRAFHEVLVESIAMLRATTTSNEEEQAVMMRVAPAAKASVEALEKFIYDGVLSKVEKMTCPICMEEVLSGTKVTKMPCSHLFHGDCILKWLERCHTCPICRFELPTN